MTIQMTEDLEMDDIIYFLKKAKLYSKNQAKRKDLKRASLLLRHYMIKTFKRGENEN